MTKSIALAMVLAISAAPAFAATTSGNAALALAARVGEHSPNLSQAEKTLLAEYLNGNSQAPYSGQKFAVTAAQVNCGASDVDITQNFCTLTFGSTKIELKGNAAQGLYATLVEAGVASDGAAGTIFETANNLKCEIVPAEVRDNGGGGASCSYTQQ